MHFCERTLIRFLNSFNINRQIKIDNLRICSSKVRSFSWSCSCRSISYQKSKSSHSSPAPAKSKPSHLNVFDRNAKILQRERSLSMEEAGHSDYLKDEVGFILADRVKDIKRDFNSILELGCGKGFLLKHLFNSTNISSIVGTDSCQSHLDLVIPPEGIPTKLQIMDEENITFENNSFDLVVSNLNLHWINDLPYTFKRINEILKPDGAFLGAMFGGQTLFELRCSLQLAELEREGGFGSHISPYAEVSDIGGLLNASGFSMLTIDTQEFQIGYPSIFELMYDLKGMGENNASWKRKIRINKDTLFAASAIYKEMYGNDDGTVPSTFQVIYMIAWKPDPSQPKPLERQKPDVSFKDLDKIK